MGNTTHMEYMNSWEVVTRAGMFAKASDTRRRNPGGWGGYSPPQYSWKGG